MLADHIPDVRKTRIRTGVHVVCGQDNIGLLRSDFSHALHINHRADVLTAMAHKHTNPGFLIGNVVFIWVDFLGDERITRLLEQFHGHRYSSTRLRYCLWNILWFLKCPGNEYAWPGS